MSVASANISGKSAGKFTTIRCWERRTSCVRSECAIKSSTACQSVRRAPSPNSISANLRIFDTKFDISCALRSISWPSVVRRSRLST